MPHEPIAILPVFTEIGKILVFLAMMSMLIILHEFGHFIIARYNGVRVNDFALGMGPTLFKWTSARSGTNYLINALPIGGYCAMKNESEITLPLSTDSFQNKSPLARLAIVLAGPIMNLIIALLLLFLSAAVLGIPDGTTTLKTVVSDEPASHAGLQPGDVIVSVNDKPVVDGGQLITRIRQSPNKPLKMVFNRAGTLHTITVTPFAQKDDSGKTIGILGFGEVLISKRVSPPVAAIQSTRDFADISTGTVAAVGKLISNPRQNASQVHGLIGIAALATSTQDLGWGIYANFAAVISISLGVFNLLPFPALDGGRVIFILAEILVRKRLDPKKEAYVNLGGLAVLGLLMIVTSLHDIAEIVHHKTHI